MAGGAKFNSHDSGSQFKKSTLKDDYRKKAYMIVIKLKLQGRLNVKSLHLCYFKLPNIAAGLKQIFIWKP